MGISLGPLLLPVLRARYAAEDKVLEYIKRVSIPWNMRGAYTERVADESPVRCGRCVGQFEGRGAQDRNSEDTSRAHRKGGTRAEDLWYETAFYRVLAKPNLCAPGKTTFFVANQANLEDMPAEKLKALEAEHKSLEESNKSLVSELKSANAGTHLLSDTHTVT